MHGFSGSVGNSWQQNDTVVYVFDGTDRKYKELELSVEAIATASYRLKNLAVRAEYVSSQDSLLGCDTFLINVFDNEGRRAGATAGLLYQLRSDAKHVDFPAKDSIYIRLNHLMPASSLDGITDVGIRITGSYH